MFPRTILMISLSMSLVATAALSGRQAAPRDTSHDAWVLTAARQMESVKAGMTRADLLKVFAVQGGLSTNSNATFVSRTCPYFKVDVWFSVVSGVAEHPNDIIGRMSRPYVDTRLIID
jgi:hypothetical protein